MRNTVKDKSILVARAVASNEGSEGLEKFVKEGK